MIQGLGPEGAPYPIEKLDAHQRDIRHVALSVFLFDGQKLLLQQRAIGKYHSGGLWANSCCSHPRWQEDVGNAARRRLGEELGISTPLTHMGELDYHADVGGGLSENEHVHVFHGRYQGPLRPNPEEVMATRWITVPDLQREIEAAPEKFTAWLRIYCRQHSGLTLEIGKLF